MSHKVPQIIRSQVARRAQFKCEYCLMPEELSFLPFQIDHIISLEHGGGSEIDNLAYSCPHCNQHKGSDLSTFSRISKDFLILVLTSGMVILKLALEKSGLFPELVRRRLNFCG